ncbi:TetR/AcrR family transcriptional regulator [Nocardia sp. NPDC051321]|uniref:TetR/AcrR family transcriptional regulator n=1 Tax=Nocardia sp. NPDC051321 TaxID=3364323 RepID=UPI003797B468
MPKIVDATERKKAVADAVFRVVAREGVENATLRRVAEEAGLVIGSVRHYFASHPELLTFALAELNSRVLARVQRHLADLSDGRTARTGSYAADILAEVLPLDAARLEESSVWLAFTTAARSRPELAELAGQPAAGVRALSRQVLSAMSDAGALRASVGDLVLETDRLAALLDGLSIAAVVDPDRRDPETMLAILRLHLASLTRQPR